MKLNLFQINGIYSNQILEPTLGAFGNSKLAELSFNSRYAIHTGGITLQPIEHSSATKVIGKLNRRTIEGRIVSFSKVTPNILGKK